MTPHPSRALCHVLTVIDGKSEELVDVVEIRGFDLAPFCTQFDVPIESDPDMLDRYAVGPDDSPFLERVLGQQVSFDFTNYAYFIEAAERDI